MSSERLYEVQMQQEYLRHHLSVYNVTPLQEHDWVSSERVQCITATGIFRSPSEHLSAYDVQPLQEYSECHLSRDTKY